MSLDSSRLPVLTMNPAATEYAWSFSLAMTSQAVIQRGMVKLHGIQPGQEVEIEGNGILPPGAPRLI